MAKYNLSDKKLINDFAKLCLENKFYESHNIICAQAKLTPEQGNQSQQQVRHMVDYQIQRGVAAPVVGELLRIENTFLHIRDIANYLPEQATQVIRNLDQTIPLLYGKNQWLAINKMKNIYHLSGERPLEYSINNQDGFVNKVTFLNKLLKKKQNPPLAPEYISHLKEELSAHGVASIDEKLSQPTANPQRITLHNDRIFLVDNTAWSRTKKFQAKSQSYLQLNNLYKLARDYDNAKVAQLQYHKFTAATNKSAKFNPTAQEQRSQEEWLYR